MAKTLTKTVAPEMAGEFRAERNPTDACRVAPMFAGSATTRN